MQETGGKLLPPVSAFSGNFNRLGYKTMGLPIHCIANEFRDTWIEILQKELNGYAVTEVVTDPPRQCNGNGEFLEKEQAFV